MRKHRRNNVIEAAQEVPGDGAEQASHTAEVSTDASEGEIAGTEIVDSVTEVVQEAEDAEQASHITQTSGDARERTARLGPEIFQRNVDTVQEALQSSAELAARLTQRSADQLGRVIDISLDEAHKAAQNSSDNLDTIIQSTSILTEVTQKLSREWVNFTRERMEKNFNRFESLFHCRTPQEVAALQTEFLRDNLENFLRCARWIAEKYVQVADETTKRTAQAIERAQTA